MFGDTSTFLRLVLRRQLFAHKMFPVANLKDQILDRICYWSILYGMFQITCAFQNL